MSAPTDLANTDLVVLAMLSPAPETTYTDLEDIAVAAYRLSPQRFGWRTKPYPSDKIVVQAIADLERSTRIGSRSAARERSRRGC